MKEPKFAPQSDAEYREWMYARERERELAEEEKQADENRPSWDTTFMEIAKVVAKRSKDPHTKVGAVIVKDKRILACGYNGKLRGCDYKFDWTTAEKYDWVIHAEINAISNASYNGVELRDADVYLTVSPCHECIKNLIQHGIKRVFYINKYKDFELTEKIANACNVQLIQMN